MKVQDPSRQTWRVTRRWVPWRRRTPLPDPPPMPDLDGPGHGDDLLALALRLLPLAVILVSVVVMSAVAVAELLLVLLVLPFAVLGRVCLGRHWVVEVRAGFQPVWETDAGGWVESRAAIEELGAALGRGDHPWHPFPAGARRGRVLEEWVLRYATSDDATFDRPRRLRLGRPGVGAAGDR